MTTLNDLKAGDTIETMVTGMRLTAEIVSIENGVITAKHAPVNWGDDVYTVTRIIGSNNDIYKGFVLPNSWFNVDQIRK